MSRIHPEEAHEIPKEMNRDEMVGDLRGGVKRANRSAG